MYCNIRFPVNLRVRKSELDFILSIPHVSLMTDALSFSDSLAGCRRKFLVKYSTIVHENECANISPLIVSVSDALLHVTYARMTKTMVKSAVTHSISLKQKHLSLEI